MHVDADWSHNKLWLVGVGIVLSDTAFIIGRVALQKPYIYHWIQPAQLICAPKTLLKLDV